MAPVVDVFRNDAGHFCCSVCVTAQHREMLDQVLNLFSIVPDFDLGIMKPAQDLFDITAGILLEIRNVLKSVHPDLVLVHGDTTTTLAASLAAYYLKIKVGHVEAGLRTGNKFAPFPEEINRRVTGAVADMHFAPTRSAAENLIREGVPEQSIWVTGNTVVDALLRISRQIEDDPEIKSRLDKKFGYLNPARKLILVTGHRRENFGEGLENICRALLEIAGARDDVEILYPVHLNPSVRKPVHHLLGMGAKKNIHLIEPVDYLSFVYLMNRSHIILTDSGGIQEEAPSLGKPVLVMREVTERPEAVNAGTVRLVGASAEKIIGETLLLLDDRTVYEDMAQSQNPYGDGKASIRIRDIVENTLMARV